MDGPPILDFRLNHLDEPALLRIKDGLIEIWRVRNQESFALLGLLVIGNAPQRSNRKRPVGIQQQRIEGRTHHRRIAAVFLKGCCDVLLQFCVGLGQGFIHRNTDHFLGVWRKIGRDVFQRDECPNIHEESTEK